MTAGSEPASLESPERRDRPIDLLRRLWLAAGVGLVLVACAAVGFVLARSWLARLPRPADALKDAHPYASAAWFPGYEAEFERSLGVRWSPYVYWQRKPFSGSYINVDSSGFRATVQTGPAGAVRRRVWFFGGSTLWGTWQRDSMTIPSLVARSLRDRGVTDVEVRNLGETGYVFTQEVLRLVLELRRGIVPDVVVFYDGANDLASTAMAGRCGIPQNEERREFDFALGRFVLTQGAREFLDVAGQFERRFQRLFDATLPARLRRRKPPLDVPLTASETVGCFVRTARIVEALSAQYGFQVLYFWQPMIGTSPKPLTRYESSVLDPRVRDGLREYLPPLAREASPRIDSLMIPLVGARFHNFAALFAGDTGAVWIDHVGHITERATSLVAARMLEPVAQTLATRRPNVQN